MNQPDEIVDLLNAKNNQLKNGIRLMHAVNTIEDIYQQRSPDIDEDEPSLVFVAGKFDNDCGKSFDIGIYPSNGFYQPVEILLKYPRNWRNWFLKKTDLVLLEFSTEDAIDFSEVYKTIWFRRYANIAPREFVCRIKTDEELEKDAHAMSAAFDNGL